MKATTHTLKEKAFLWLLKNIFIPRNEIFDIPGFIIKKLSPKKQRVNLRQILIPEDVIVDIEKSVKELEGEEGRKKLYTIGKKFGYRHALHLRLPQKGAYPEERLVDFTNLFMKAAYAFYASNFETEIDIPHKMFKIQLNDFIVCRKNGLGWIFSEGEIAGIWSYIMNDNSIECVHVKCEGRGDEWCESICAPPEYLKANGLEPIRVENFQTKIEPEYKYNIINRVKKCVFTRTTLKDLLECGLLRQEGGIILQKQNRFILVDASFIYILENELKNDKLIFDISFEWGKDFIEKENPRDLKKFVAEFLCACGFGDLYIRKLGNKNVVTIRFFPWTSYADKINFAFLRGLLSGMLSAKESVEFKEVIKSIKGEEFVVHVTESEI
jgi:predicted hydrocarbon binding protein